MASSLRDLKVWQEAVGLAADTIRAARGHVRRETRAVSDELMRTALTAASLVADGYGRFTAPEQRQIYRAAKRELLKLETQLAIARRADLIAAPAHEDLAQRTHAVSRLLGGYLVYLERQLPNEATGRTGS